MRHQYFWAGGASVQSIPRLSCTARHELALSMKLNTASRSFLNPNATSFRRKRSLGAGQGDGLLVGGAIGEHVGAALGFLEERFQERGEFALPDYAEIDGGKIGEVQHFHAWGKFLARNFDAEAEAIVAFDIGFD